MQAIGDEYHRGNVRSAEQSPRERVPRRRAPAGARDFPMPAVPGCTSSGDESFADTGDAYFLSRRSRRGRREQMPGQSIVLCGPLLGPALDSGPPCRCEHGWNGERGEQRQCRMDRDEQGDGHGEPQDPTAGGEDRHVQVVQHKDLVAQHRQTIQIVGALVMSNGGHRCLESCDVCLQRDLDLVAKPALHTRADSPQKPGRRRRDPQADRGADDQASAAVEHTLAE